MKPSNILVTGQDKPLQERGVVKIADFGLARLFQAPLRPLTDVDAVVVTIWYRAPELLLGAKHYTSAIDLWAIGCIFAELITSKPLFQGVERERKGDDRNPFQSNQIDKIFRILGKPSAEIWPTIGELPHWAQAQSWANHAGCLQDRVRGLQKGTHGYDLLCRLLEYDPTKRITAENALKHPFFTVRTLPYARDGQTPPTNDCRRRSRCRNASRSSTPTSTPTSRARSRNLTPRRISAGRRARKVRIHTDHDSCVSSANTSVLRYSTASHHFRSQAIASIRAAATQAKSRQVNVDEQH